MMEAFFSCFLRRSRLAADPKFISGFYPVILRIIRKLELKRENRAKKRRVAAIRRNSLIFNWYPERDSNPYTFRLQILSLLRLPFRHPGWIDAA